MFRLFRRTNGLIALIAIFCGLLVFMIWIQLIHQLEADRKETLSTAIQRNSNLAVSLEQYAIRTVRNADAVLQLVKMEFESNGKDINFNELLDKGVIDLDYFNGVAIIDANGKLLLTNMNSSKSSSKDYSDREHFYFHKKNRNQLYISKPLMSRSIGRPVIVVSRRIEKPDGSFNGTVAVQIEPSIFTKFYSNANLGEHDIISLISPDGITYARRTGNLESSGEDISKSPLFTHVAKNPDSNYFAKDALRGIPTYFSYRKLEAYPIIATVGSSEKDVLAGYYSRANRDYIFGAIITILLVLFTILISNGLLRRKRVTQEIRISESRYRSIFENSQDAIIVVLPDGIIETMNKAAALLFKHQKSRSQPVLFSQFFKEAMPELQLSAQELSLQNVTKEEVVFIRNDGSSFTSEVVYSSYQDFEGNNRFVVLIRDISLRKEMGQRLMNEQKRYQRKLTKQIILAQEREREAIGHEMHDNVNQILTTIKLYLEMAMNNPSLREDLIPKSIHHIMDCITEIRNLSRELSAPTLGTQSLIDSVKALLEMVASSSGLKISFKYEQYKISIIKDQKLAIYRILQEQLNNIIKHAGATEVNILISQNENNTELRICDNGKGFDIYANRNGIGLNNILSRAKVFGGEMLIDSVIGKGTVLKIIMPIIKAEVEERMELKKTELGIRD